MSQTYQQAAASEILTCYVGKKSILDQIKLESKLCPTKGGYCKVRMINGECKHMIICIFLISN